MKEISNMTGPRWFEFRITFGNILTVAILLITIIMGYGRIQAQMDFLVSSFHDHQGYDDRRFTEVASKETRAARDKEVDKSLSNIETRLIRIENFLLDEYATKPRH